MPEFQGFSYDVLVIGAGGAGLRAAIEAAASGAKVGVVCKSLLWRNFPRSMPSSRPSHASPSSGFTQYDGRKAAHSSERDVLA